MFQFRLHINGTNDGDIIAKHLRELAGRLVGKHLTPGMRLDIGEGVNIGGYARVSCDFDVQRFPSCADAERALGFTLTWSEYDTFFIGKYEGQPVAAVGKD